MRAMNGQWDVFFVGSDCQVDRKILGLWVSGYDVNAATLASLRSNVLHEFDDADEACVLSEINDHYRLFSLLERFLENPPRLLMQRPFLLTVKTVRLIIEQYYDIDDSVVREVSGKRPSGKLRKEAEEISEKTGVSITSCRRQLDNFRRIYKFVEDMKGSLLCNIKKHFLLPTNLAKKYATAVFLACYKFELNKKRLGYLNFEDLVACSVQMINHWSHSSVEKGSDEDLSIDREFLHDLKDARSLNDRDNVAKFKLQILKGLKSRLAIGAYDYLKENFKPMFRSVVEIAIDLNHSRDFRDFFVDLAENIVIPCRVAKWTKDDLSAFLRETSITVHDYYITKVSNVEMALNWQRYMEVLTGCALQMYRP